MLYKIILISLSIVLCNGDIACNKIRREYGYVCVCNSTYCDTISSPQQLPIGKFHFYYTSRYNPGFNHDTGHFRKQNSSYYNLTVELSRTKTFQKVRGFGGSFTDAFGANLNSLSSSTQNFLLRSLFSEDGIEYTSGRVIIGSSDFSFRNYTYLPKFDPSLASFSLTPDDFMYKIPCIQKAINMSRRPIHLFGTAWNAPEWMKMYNTSGTGYLKPEFRQQWADYHVKFLDAYKAEGIEFWTLSTGNEPLTLYMVPAMDILAMFPEEQREWIVNNLGPALERANYSMKVIVLDDMRTYAKWWMDAIMRDKKVEKYILGVGLHYYLDYFSSPKILDDIHEKYPDHEIIYTESSMNILITVGDENDTDPSLQSGPKKSDRGGPHLGSWKRGGYYAQSIIENLNHWTTTFVEWNFALNENGGPNLNDYPCDATIIVNAAKDEFYKQPMFYVMGHFSKFIQPDAVIVDLNFVNNTLLSGSNTSETGADTTPQRYPRPGDKIATHLTNDLQYVGAVNPDGSTSVILYNPRYIPLEVNFYDPVRGYAYVILEPESISTLVYW